MKPSSLTLIPLCGVLACAAPMRNVPEPLAMEAPDMMSRELWDCAGVTRARAAGFLNDPMLQIDIHSWLDLPNSSFNFTPEIQSSVGDSIMFLDRYDNLLVPVVKSAYIDSAIFDMKQLDADEFAELREFLDSLQQE